MIVDDEPLAREVSLKKSCLNRVLCVFINRIWFH